MRNETFHEVTTAFGLSSNAIFKPFGSGLINNTYLVEDGKQYILQKINTDIFTKPNIISQNIKVCSEHFAYQHPHYLFITPIQTTDQEQYFIKNGNYWRLIPFITNSITFDKVSKPQQAFEAAKVVGAFSRKTSNIQISLLDETIPDFHNLTLRFQQFQFALENGNPKRLKDTQKVIGDLVSLKSICDHYENIKNDENISLRVQHHDTKINNILFDKSTDKGLCLCDLDTIMPGYFISDLGDMMRTYLSDANEEEQELSKVKARPTFYKAIMEGYLSEMENILSQQEKEYLHYSGEFLIYMQALRFFTDYLNDDAYYSTTYAHQNLSRTLNQLKLLEEYEKLRGVN